MLKLFAVASAGITSMAATGITASAVTKADADVIMMIRHGEKPPASGKPFGVNADGEQDTSSLTPRGWCRAGALAGLFAPNAGTAIRQGLRVPDTIYASTATTTAHHRMVETVTPLAAKLGRPVNTDHPTGDPDGIAAALVKLSGVTLVSWEHKEIPLIAARFGTVSPVPPASWPDDRFDMVWVFTRAGSGWTFTQVPQLLLDGDSAEPF